jgi:hypothetical protein
LLDLGAYEERLGYKDLSELRVSLVDRDLPGPLVGRVFRVDVGM